MMWRHVKVFFAVFGVVSGIAMFCYAASAGVKTDKESYQYGEAVKVTFSGATGLDSDWMCIVPAGSPATDGGDYKYMPKGSTTGTLAFDPPAPGKYEVRAFYNYIKSGYVAAASTAFTVTGDAAYSKAKEQTMSRELNSGNPLEATVPSDKGLVYIFREPWGMSAEVDIEVKCNAKPVVVLSNSEYYPFVVRAGEFKFETGSLFKAGTKSTVSAGLTGETAVNVKPGYVYYLRVKVMPMAYYDNYLDIMPHLEGAEMIRTYKLNVHK